MVSDEAKQELERLDTLSEDVRSARDQAQDLTMELFNVIESLTVMKHLAMIGGDARRVLARIKGDLGMWLINASGLIEQVKKIKGRMK